MKTIKNGQFLSSESIISVHFNDLRLPTKMQYSFDHEGKKIFLAEYGCDANDLADILDLSENDLYYERAEGFFVFTYDVANKKLGTPFEDSMIPK